MNNKPWLPYLITEYIKRIIEPRKVFEWGSGASTLFFAQFASQLVSVEHDINWYYEIKPRLSEWNGLDYLYIPYEGGEICGDKSDPCCYKSGSTLLGAVNFKKYATVIDSYGYFDLILIDGMARTSCLAHAVSHIRPGGCIILDNTGDRPYYLEKTEERLFGNYEQGWEKIKVMGYGPDLDYKWECSIFLNNRKNDYEKIRKDNPESP